MFSLPRHGRARGTRPRSLTAKDRAAPRPVSMERQARRQRAARRALPPAVARGEHSTMAASSRGGAQPASTGRIRPTSPRALATPLEISSVKPMRDRGHEHRRDRGGAAEPADQREGQHHQEHRARRRRRSAGAARSDRARARAGRSRRRRRRPGAGRARARAAGGPAAGCGRRRSCPASPASAGARPLRSATRERVTSLAGASRPGIVGGRGGVEPLGQDAVVAATEDR